MPAVTLIGLTESQAADPTVVGTKFARLASIHSHTEVPPAWCIGSPSFAQALGPERLAQLTAIMHDLTVTLGCDLAALPTRLQAALAGLSLPADVLQGLAELVADGSFAVRSSAEGEDSHQHSYAGLYESYLHRRGLAEVADAVVTCWRSYYSPRSVLARLRAGDVSTAPRMGVIVQHMVDADLAGVAFTQDTQVWVSATIGTGEHLVDGSAEAATLVIRPGEAPPPYDHVALAASGLKSSMPFGRQPSGTPTADASTDQASRAADDIDLEWAWTRAHGLRILQVRPVTAALPGSSSTQPRLASAPLYAPGELPESVQLGACADLYGEMTAKRSALFALAAEHGFTVSDGLIVTLNGAGLTESALARPWDRWPGQQPHLSQEVVIDAGARIRQNIARHADIEPLLGNALNLAGDPHTLHTILIRRFVRGCAGALTQQRTDGRVLLQHCADGLVALNRGFAVPAEHLLPEPSHHARWQAQPPIGSWGRQALQRMAAFTDRVNRIHPGACLEWVLTDHGQPHLVDYSLTATCAAPKTAIGGRVLSAGRARGPLLAVADSPALERLSIAPIVSIGHTADVPDDGTITALRARIADLPAKPILYASRPYVILSQVIDEVAGMVFDGGSALCHLAILLREAQLPAIVAPGFDIGIHHGQTAAIDDSGALRLLPIGPTSQDA